MSPFTNTPLHAAIAENDIETGIAIYPNPVYDKFTVLSSQASMKKIELFNLLGEKIIEKDCANSDKRVDMTMQHLASGLYYAKIYTEKGAVTMKVLKD